MYWGLTDPKKFYKLETQEQKEALIKEIEAHIKRWTDSVEQHKHYLLTEYRTINVNGGASSEAIKRNRMFIKDLKSLLNLVKKIH